MSTPVQPQQQQGPAGGGGLVSKVGGPRNAAILGAGATVVLVALVAMKRGGSTDTGAATPIQQGFDSGPYDMWNAWQQQYEDLQNQVNDIADQNKPPTPPTTNPPSTLPAPIDKPPVPPPAPTPKPNPVPPKPPTTTPPKTTPKPPPSQYVTIKKGDTLSAIAAKAHISMATLKKLNPVFWTNPKYHSGNTIFSGGKVRVK
jgi:hypothetical protein